MLRGHREADLLLHGPPAEHAAADHGVGEVGVEAPVPLLRLDLHASAHHLDRHQLLRRALPVPDGPRGPTDAADGNGPSQLLKDRALALEEMDEHANLGHFTGDLTAQQRQKMGERQGRPPRDPLVSEGAEEHVGHQAQHQLPGQVEHGRVRPVAEDGEARVLGVAGVEKLSLVLWVLVPVAVVSVLAERARRWAELLVCQRGQLQRH
mmetsp:Transcript_34080/g.89031  ORF Transcript_34080/g.89031 Transcript_34080/m.89031 type:complete len:208 (-) Transcript_34080:362-985(-)